MLVLNACLLGEFIQKCHQCLTLLLLLLQHYHLHGLHLLLLLLLLLHHHLHDITLLLKQSNLLRHLLILFVFFQILPLLFSTPSLPFSISFQSLSFLVNKQLHHSHCFAFFSLVFYNITYFLQLFSSVSVSP